MKLQPLSSEKTNRIVKNVVRACEDITKLAETSYKWLHICSGFIAHFNLDGFKWEYRAPGSLRLAVLRWKNHNQWEHLIGGEDSKYYEQKRDMYNRICKALEAMPAFNIKIKTTVERVYVVSVIAKDYNLALSKAYANGNNLPVVKECTHTLRNEVYGEAAAEFMKEEISAA